MLGMSGIDNTLAHQKFTGLSEEEKMIHQFKMMIFDKRINYIRDNAELKEIPFKSCYTCSQLLPQQFMFENLKK